MNFIFRSYPEHPWFSGWTFEPRGCSAIFRESNSNLFFQSKETVGRIIPDRKNPKWAVQIPVPQNSRTNLLFNGFCAYAEKKGERYGAEVLVPEPGVLWGSIDNIPSPVILTDLPMEQTDDTQWLDADDGAVLLSVRENCFCLITKARLKKDAAELAEHYFALDFEEALTAELTARDGAKTLFEEMVHHDSLASICVESMMKALRPGEGRIPMAWCQSSASLDARMDANEIYPLVLAWKLVDISVAEELITCVLKSQTNSGAIPVHNAPHASHTTMEAPKPFIAKATESVWEVREDPELLEILLPLLRRHLQWLLHHFDPKRSGVFCWKNRSEPIVQEVYETDLATVDLTILLLTEIKAFNRLRRRSLKYGEGPNAFEQERDALEHSLSDQFWNSDENGYTNALLRDHIVQLRGFTAFTPLIWDKLPHNHRIAILERVRESGTLPGGISVLSWRENAMDDNSFPLLQQLIVFQALQTADPHGELLSDFSRVTLQGFVEWHTLSLEEENRLQINPVLAAFIMNVQSIRQYRHHALGGITGYAFKMLNKAKIDRFDLAIFVVTIFSVFGAHLTYKALNAPPPLEILEAQMNTAYANRNTKEVLENSVTIIKHYPEEACDARLLTANIYMIQGQYKKATELLEQVRAKYPDSPGPMISLGLAYQLQGRYEEAESNYYEFCYIFEEIFPELVEEVNRFRYLMQEGFDSPPGWVKLYRYQLMHELQ